MLKASEVDTVIEVDIKLLSTFSDKNIVSVGGNNGQVAFFNMQLARD